MNLENRVQRFEQQLDAFENLHAHELKGFEEKLAAYVRLQADEVKFLREELAELKKELANPQDSGATASHPSSPTLTRREFLRGATGQRQT